MKKNNFKKIYHRIEKIGSILFCEKYFRNRQLRIIQSFAEGMGTILELGVGTKSYFHKNNRNYRIICFDIFEISLKKAKEKSEINDYVIGNVIELDNCINEKSFDLLCAIDLIEHLKKEQGFELIKKK